MTLHNLPLFGGWDRRMNITELTAGSLPEVDVVVKGFLAGVGGFLLSLIDRFRLDREL
jgi:hypothetical protein